VAIVAVLWLPDGLIPESCKIQVIIGVYAGIFTGPVEIYELCSGSRVTGAIQPHLLNALQPNTRLVVVTGAEGCFQEFNARLPMKDLNPEFVKSLSEKVNSSPFYGLTAMQLTEVRRGKCVMEVTVAEKHLQPYRMVHGGVFASLVDSAAYWAVFTQIDDDTRMFTVDIKVNYLAPASAGRLIAKGKSVKIGRTLCLGEAAVESGEGRILAHGTATMMIVPGADPSGAFDLPPKKVP
jgi:uncharacterized protein (TIGR00369 family)